MKFNQTLTSSSPLLALGSLLFNGTGIWLSGSQAEASTTSYEVVFDSQTSAYSTYPSSGALFAQYGLSTTQEHHINVTPASIVTSATIEIDVDANMYTYVDDSQLFATFLSDSSSVRGSWTANQCLGNAQNVYGGTCQTSQTSGDSITYKFKGDALTVYGALENAQAGYTVSIDGSSPTTYAGNAASASSTSSVVLAFASNLGSGEHVITITNKPSDGASKLEIDYVILWSNMSQSSSSSSTGMSKSKIPAIVGTVLGCVVFAGIFLLILLRRERINARKAASTESQNPDARNFGWTKGEKEAETRSVASTAAEDDKTWNGSPVTTATGTAFSVVSHPPRAAPPTHTKTTSFDQPWLECAPRLSSIHPLDSDSTTSPPARISFLSKWRR
ncbi:hypothetical protein FRB95_011496 [Tulasnella sp. JGI-2019a]|nr:hypothetical protein FRB95_011496 [Tulasnella sp. JGI-2019a]